MNITELSTIIAIVGVIVSGTWVVTRYATESIRQRTDLVVSLYREYFSQDMMDARRIGWFALNKMNASRPVIFSNIWSDSQASDQDIASLYRVMAFFHSVHALDSLHRLNRRLAKKLFAYQYTHWRRKITPMVEDSLAFDKDESEVLKAFYDDQLLWLYRGAKVYDPATRTVPSPLSADG